MITETDDFFCHQIAEPHAVTLLNDVSWSERAYFTVSDPDRFGIDIGVSSYPNLNVNMFQAGRWDGEIRIGGKTLLVEGIPGHRDRTWGVRVSGEGRFRSTWSTSQES